MEIQHRDQLLLVMVGLPARGKSFLAHKICSYFSWLGNASEIFNVGKYRRASSEKGMNHDSSFFNGQNVEMKKLRDDLACAVLDQALTFLETRGKIAIFDATNTTKARRELVLAKSHERLPNLNIIFVESICTDVDVIRSNLEQKTQHSPDYRQMTSQEEAMTDLRKRIENYEQVYETIDNDALNYIKLINLQSKVICNRIYSRSAFQLISLLMSLHICARPIYLTRPGLVGQSSDMSEHHEAPQHSFVSKNISNEHSNSISKTSQIPLNAQGRAYARWLRHFLQEQQLESSEGQPQRQSKSPIELEVLTSTVPRAIETVQALGLPYTPQSSLNDRNTGSMHGMSMGEIQKFQTDPFYYRIPGGESFCDFIQHMSPLIIELERQREPVLVVSHLTTLQLLRGYLCCESLHESLEAEIPSHVVIKLTPTIYGYKEERFPFQP